jgi:hypothetical protein
MKPTASLHKAAAMPGPVAAPGREPGAATGPSLVEDLVARKRTYVKALEQTRELRASGRIARGVDERLARLADSATARPEPGPKGTAVIRVVGVTAGKQRLPLPGLDVRLKLGEKVLTEGKTDFNGLAILALATDRLEGRYLVEVAGPDCQVYGCDHGELKPGGQPAHLLELGQKGGLLPAFRRGEVWLLAHKSASERAGELKHAVEQALANQAKELERAIKELDDAIAHCQPIGRSSS